MKNKSVDGPVEHPSDWPGAGSIDLDVHDLPHRSSTKEWWYLNAHVKDTNQREYSVFVAFFAMAIDRNEETQENVYAYSVAWALVDVARQAYLYDSALDASAPKVGLRQLDQGDAARDPLFSRALREIFARGAVPLPDRILVNDPQVAWDKLHLDFDGNSLSKLPDGSYQLRLCRADHHTAVDLTFKPTKNVVRHGQDGVVHGASSEQMFYYFTPSCDVTGTVTVDAQTSAASGRGWYDHEFGRQIGTPDGKVKSEVAWNWVSAQLDDGWELSLYQLFESETGERLPESGVIAIAPDGSAERIEDFELDALETWTSTQTFNSYPSRWSLRVPKLGVEVTLQAEFGAQEFITVISPPGFWEGRIRIEGSRSGKPIRGLGFIERSGFSQVDTIDDFFSAVGNLTRHAIHGILPDEPSPAALARLISQRGHAGWSDGVDAEQLWRTLVKPLREIVDRGGKTWRSYGLLACIDAVGGNSQRFVDWLALPELLHVGSLITDDVQDASEMRRGGPSAHVVHGVPLAINAGNAAYFLSELILDESQVSPEKRNVAYSWFFAALRAAHAGQALDISGLHDVIEQVVESGDGAALEKRLRATHRLKSAAPPAALAYVAAIVGDGTREQAQALCELFEAYGVAFQIIDDVLNLKGFERGLKTRGEDITEGKVTAPVAEAMSRLGLDERRALWSIISSRPKEVQTVAAAIETIRSCGALEACEQKAHAIVEHAWQRVESLLLDSHVKAKLRAFGWFVLERHY